MLERPPRRDRQREHQREYRRRQRAGEGVAPAPFTVAIVNFLIETKWLAETDAGDRAAIGKAMSAALANAAKHRCS